MSSCKHRQLTLLVEHHDRVRCRHCHLTIRAADLTSRYCPECFEASRTKRYDFEEVLSVDSGLVRYRCEECGGIIEVR
jgi:hypothetical protein